jgi:hypothetical protein
LGPGVNPTTFNFTITYNASIVVGGSGLHIKEDFFVYKMHKASRGVVNFYSAGVVTHDRMYICRIRT